MAYRTQGVPPKPASKRRRRNVRASYGAAEPVTAPAASPGPRTLGIADAHPLIVDMWHAVQGSVESRFFSAADWERPGWELWHANYAMTGSMSARAWAAIQDGLNELLLSPAIKRRAGFELRPQAVDADEDAAVSMLGRYKQVSSRFDGLRRSAVVTLKN